MSTFKVGGTVLDTVAFNAEGYGWSNNDNLKAAVEKFNCSNSSNGYNDQYVTFVIGLARPEIKWWSDEKVRKYKHKSAEFEYCQLLVVGVIEH